MIYLRVFDDYEAEMLVRNGKAEVVGPYQALVEENIEYALYGKDLKEEDLECMTQYVSDNWQDVIIDEEDIQRQIRGLIFSDEEDGE